MTKRGAWLGLLLTGLLAAGCSGGGEQKTAVPPAAQTAGVVAEKPGPWKGDGMLSPGEYSRMQQAGDMTIYSRVDGEVVRIALQARTGGWVAIGIGPEERMKGADIIMGMVVNGQAAVVDMYSTGPTGPHPQDQLQGGRMDISAFGGTEQDGVTTIEFERKLRTGDAMDKDLKLGENKILWAIGETKDFTMRHGKRGVTTLTLLP